MLFIYIIYYNQINIRNGTKRIFPHIPVSILSNNVISSFSAFKAMTAKPRRREITLIIITNQLANNVTQVNWSTHGTTLDNDVLSETLVIGSPKTWLEYTTCNCNATNGSRMHDYEAWIAANDIDLDPDFRATLSFNGSLRGITPTLVVSSVDIIGDVTPDTSNMSLVFFDTTFDNIFSQQSSVTVNCMNFTLGIFDSSFRNTYIEIDTLSSAQVLIKHSSFAAPSGYASEHLYGLVMNTVKSSRNELVSRIQVENCTFSNLGGDADLDSSSGAISIKVLSRAHSLYLSMNGCTFITNRRALDVSLKGASEILIDNCTFTSNFGNGSGGAIRFSNTKERGFGELTVLGKTNITILRSTFDNNWSENNMGYPDSHIYYQTRSPGGGGAIFAFLTAASPLPNDGLITMIDSMFENNTATEQGGSVFISWGITAHIKGCSFSNTNTKTRPKLGDILHGLSSIQIRNTDFTVVTSDSTTPVLYYQASDFNSIPLQANNVKLHCPAGYLTENINSDSKSLSGGLETLQLFCRTCPDEKYTLRPSQMSIGANSEFSYDSSICLDCPYGADCVEGVQNNLDFWGVVALNSGNDTPTLNMYRCPQDYCGNTNNNTAELAYNSCFGNRTGTLCGRCKDGYSESLFGAYCISNASCGFHRWYILLLLAIYGIVYLLFFMFEGEWGMFLNYIYLKFRHCGKQIPLADDHSGYFQSFMYFIQTATLLRIELIVKEDKTYTSLYRPQNLIPSWVVKGLEQAFSFDVLSMHQNTCIWKNVTPVSKAGLKLSFVVYLYFVLLLFYILSGFCCRFRKQRPKLGTTGLDSRMLCTVLALFLYTYQLIAEQAFFFLNCTNVESQRVLFYDANVVCMQQWQYLVIGCVAIFIVPFFLILLFGPTLLKSGEISLTMFFVSMIFPLFLCVPIIVMYFWKTKRKYDENECTSDILDILTGPYRHLSDDEPTEGDNQSNPSTIDTRDPDQPEEALEVVKPGEPGKPVKPPEMVNPQEPVKQMVPVKHEICWEGVINFRRMLMILLFTFINDDIMRQMSLAFISFLILMVHIYVLPFKLRTPNMMESVSLSLLLILSMANLVKATLSASMVVPQGSTYVAVVMIEWIEVICMGILPMALSGFLLVCLALGILRQIVCCFAGCRNSTNEDTTSPSIEESRC